MVSKTRNGGNWTDARFATFIKSALRAASHKWGPRHRVRKRSHIGRNLYVCSGYGRGPHNVRATVKHPTRKGKRVNNVQVDHIIPVVDPIEGFVSWDEYIKRMFCEEDGLQVLCHACHTRKTKDERKARNAGN